MARPKLIPGRGKTSELILDAALQEFSLHGYACRLEDIALRCGIQRASLLYHFSSKQILIEAVINKMVIQATERLLAALADTEGQDYASKALRITQELQQLEQEQHGIVLAAFHALMTPNSGQIIKSFKLLVDVVTDIAMQSGSPESVAEVRAVITHIFMGELGRLALGEHASELWGEQNATVLLVERYFSISASQKQIKENDLS